MAPSGGKESTRWHLRGQTVPGVPSPGARRGRWHRAMATGTRKKSGIRHKGAALDIRTRAAIKPGGGVADQQGDGNPGRSIPVAVFAARLARRTSRPAATRRNSLTSHKNTIRSLYVLCIPTNRPYQTAKWPLSAQSQLRRPRTGRNIHFADPMPRNQPDCPLTWQPTPYDAVQLPHCHVRRIAHLLRSLA
jgi:hypothetical protein